MDPESESPSVLSDFLRPHGLYRPWNSPDQNTGVGSCSLLQGIFLTQGSNPGLPYRKQILYQLSHQGSPCTRRVWKRSEHFDLVTGNLFCFYLGLWMCHLIWESSASGRIMLICRFAYFCIPNVIGSHYNSCSPLGMVAGALLDFLPHPVLLRNHWQTLLSTFKVYGMMVWFMWIVKWLSP